MGIGIGLIRWLMQDDGRRVVVSSEDERDSLLIQGIKESQILIVTEEQIDDGFQCYGIGDEEDTNEKGD